MNDGLTASTQCVTVGRMSTTIRFSDRLRDIKASRKFTLARMTKILGRTSTRTVQDWIYGNRVPHRDIQELVLLKLLKAKAARTRKLPTPAN